MFMCGFFLLPLMTASRSMLSAVTFDLGEFDEK